MKKIGSCLAVLLFAVSCASIDGGSSSSPAGREPAVPSTPVLLQSDLLGASSENLEALLGAPSLSRREGAGEYRRYGLKQCTLIVILSRDQAATATVKHLDAAALKSGQEKPDLTQCLAAG